ncbi:MAG: DUF4181 domain-containing protein [Clostridiaceae bacterium]|nr:DUF4181 domain-containing protein [Clostridiaceae bacterium]
MLNIFFLLTVLLIGFGIYIDRLVKIKDKFNIKKEKNLYKHVNKTHKWSEIAITIITLLVLYLIAFVYPKQLEIYYFMGALAVLHALRTFMEWKYEEESNRYRISILNSSFFLLLFVVLGLSSL